MFITGILAIVLSNDGANKTKVRKLSAVQLVCVRACDVRRSRKRYELYCSVIEYSENHVMK